MAIDVKVGSVKAADPGLGFTLNFGSPLGSTLKVVITMTDLRDSTKHYTSEVTLLNSISDQELVFVVPFGDNTYAPSNCLSFKIDLYWPNDAKTPNETLTGVVMGEKGVFNFSTSVPTVIYNVPKTGDMLQSEDGQFIGIYQKDGNFCVYPQFGYNQSDLNPVYSSHSNIDQPTMFWMNKMNDGTPYFNICTPDFSKMASQSNLLSASEYTAFSINSVGSLCYNYVPISFTKV